MNYCRQREFSRNIDNIITFLHYIIFSYNNYLYTSLFYHDIFRYEILSSMNDMQHQNQAIDSNKEIVNISYIHYHQ